MRSTGAVMTWLDLDNLKSFFMCCCGYDRIHKLSRKQKIDLHLFQILSKNLQVSSSYGVGFVDVKRSRDVFCRGLPGFERSKNVKYLPGKILLRYFIQLE